MLNKLLAFFRQEKHTHYVLFYCLLAAYCMQEGQPLGLAYEIINQLKPQLTIITPLEAEPDTKSLPPGLHDIEVINECPGYVKCSTELAPCLYK